MKEIQLQILLLAEPTDVSPFLLCPHVFYYDYIFFFFATCYPFVAFTFQLERLNVTLTEIFTMEVQYLSFSNIQALLSHSQYILGREFIYLFAKVWYLMSTVVIIIVEKNFHDQGYFHPGIFQTLEVSLQSLR